MYYITYAVCGAAILLLIHVFYGLELTIAALGALGGYVFARDLKRQKAETERARRVARPPAGSKVEEHDRDNVDLDLEHAGRSDPPLPPESIQPVHRSAHRSGSDGLSVPPSPSANPWQADHGDSGSGDPPDASPSPAPSPVSPPPVSPPGSRGVGRSSEGSVARLIQSAWSWVTGGNWPAKLGALVFMVGIGLLLALAAEAGFFYLSVGARLVAVALLAGGFMIAGLWLVRRQTSMGRTLGLSLEGTAFGMWYMVAFTALRLFELVSAAWSLSAMAIVAVIALLMGVWQNAQILAILAVIGGFIAPVLSGGEADNAWGLTIYTLVLAAGTIAISFKRPWYLPQVLAMVLTFGVGLIAVSQYGSTSLMPFLVLGISAWIGFALAGANLARQGERHLLVSLVYATPTLALAFLSRVLEPDWVRLAWICVLAAGMYVALWFRARREGHRVATDFLVIAAGLLTLAVPLSLDGRMTAVVWAMEGCAVLAAGLSRRMQWSVIAGTGLMVVSWLLYLIHMPDNGPNRVLDPRFLGALLMAITGIVGGWRALRDGPTMDWPTGRTRILALLLLAGGVAWWLGAGIDEIHHHLSEPAATRMLIIFLAASGLALVALGVRIRWEDMAFLGLLASVPIALLWLVEVGFAALGVSPLYISPVWTIAVIAMIVSLRLTALWPASAMRIRTPITVLSLAITISIAAHAVHQVIEPAGGWHATALATVGLMILLLVRYLPRLFQLAPFLCHPGSSGWLVPATVGIFALWALVSNFYPGSVATRWGVIPYVPIFNPLDLVQLAGLAVIVGFTVNGRRTVSAGAAVLLLVWLATSSARIAHHFFGVDWRAQALLESTVFHSGVSLSWGAAALATMLWATRTSRRELWFVGSGVAVLVVVKLLLVDLAGSGSIARIVSFLGVGGLLLLAGYVAPVPPRDAD